MGSLGTISVKFYRKVKGWLRYEMAEKYFAESLDPLSRAHELTDRQTTDGFAIAKTRM